VEESNFVFDNKTATKLMMLFVFEKIYLIQPFISLDALWTLIGRTFEKERPMYQRASKDIKERPMIFLER